MLQPAPHSPGTLDIDLIRAQTPATKHLAYFHNAGAALMPTPVLETVKRHLDLEAEIGGYAAADQEQARIDAVYTSVAKLINAAPDEIALTENATVAWQLAFYAQHFEAGDRILTAQSEYAANYVAYLHMAQRTGVKIDVVPNDANGQLDVAALERMVDKNVKLISITWIPTNGGLVNPAAAVGRIAKAHHIPYLLDGCQAVGQIEVDIKAIGCDYFSATGRKFLRGPRGTGFLYVRKDNGTFLEPPMLDHHAAPWVATNSYKLRNDARRFETWESNYAAQLGLGTAIDYALHLGMAAIETRARSLAERLRNGLAEIKGAQVRDLGIHPSAIVSFTVDGHHSATVIERAARENITIGISSPESTRLDAESRALPHLVRASPHYYNTEAEIDVLLDFCHRL